MCDAVIHSRWRWHRCAILLTALHGFAAGLYDAGDVAFSVQDIGPQRVVPVKPSDRILFVNSWPKSLSKVQQKRGGLRQSVPPKIVTQKFVPDDAADTFDFDFLPNITFRLVEVSDVIRPPSKTQRADADAEESPANSLAATLADLLDDAVVSSTSKAAQYVGRFNKLMVEHLGDYCMDEPPVADELPQKMLSVLRTIASHPRRLGWLLQHVLQQGRVQGDELIFEGSTPSVFTLRLDVWSNFEDSVGKKFLFGPHDHGRSVIGGLLLAGNLDMHLFHRAGRLLDAFEFWPFLSREGRVPGNTSKRWEEEARLTQSPMKGTVLRYSAGSSYILPPRWVHRLQRLPEDKAAAKVSINLGLQVRLDSERCGVVLPMVVRVPATQAPPVYEDWYQMHSRRLRQRVAALLRSQTLRDVDASFFDQHQDEL
eukprot:TRINITY_DN60104_c0_g1_i1.p1 TRINITY_DN60104_c0_g1~~TRINITY_DN60104_c0_g1_i1.p1  ORF type:complete len:426 (+),score=56.72 TRINITY_DN60104_c0_g1_i1:316-1593(+)